MELTANLAAYKAENQHVNRAVRGQVDKINISLYMGVCGGGWGGCVYVWREGKCKRDFCFKIKQFLVKSDSIV